MNVISVGNHKINLNFETQVSKSGRPFRLSGISLVLDKPAIWIDKRLTHGTKYWFRYLDKDEFFGFEFSPDGKFVGKVILP